MKIKLVSKFISVVVVVLTTLILAVSPVRALIDDTGVYTISYLGNTLTANVYQGELLSVNWTAWPSTGASRFEIPSNLYSLIYTYQITEIDPNAFAGCKVSSIYLGSFLNNVKGPANSVPTYTFANSSNLTSIEFEAGYNKMTANMFQGCTNLTSITFPNSSFNISDSAFQDCTNLASVTFPSGIGNIGDSAFSGCGKLTKAIFQGAKPSIGTNAFSGTAAGFKIYYHISQSGWPGNSGYSTQAYCYVTCDRNYSGGGQSRVMTNVNSDHITAPTNPTRTGYTFSGWYKEAACTNKWNFGGDTVTGDLTLYAQWIDATAPTLSNVTPSLIKAGTSISATSNETGTIYLVLKGTSSYTSKTALDGASPKKTAAVSTAGSAVTVDTTGLTGGVYQVYAVDAVGNVSAASADITIDNNALALSSITPTILKSGTAISATSNETGTIYLVLKGTSSYTSKTALAADAKKFVVVTVAGSAVTIDTTGVTAGIYQLYAVDAVGNVSAASADITIDNIAPTLTAHTPTGADTVLTTALTLTFSEIVTAGAGNITIYKADGAQVEAITASKATISGNTVTIIPTNKLALATGYYILIDATAFQDTAGNAYAGISDTTAWSFTTTAATISVVFSRPIANAKLNINTGSMVIAKLIDNGAGIDTSKVTIQIDDSAPVKPIKLIQNSNGYTLYYVITGINYGITDNKHTITVTATDSAGRISSGSVTFSLEPKRKGFGFGKLRFD